MQHAGPPRQPPAPCALFTLPLEPKARQSPRRAPLPLPSVTPFRQPRGRAAKPSGLRSANFYKPDGGWQANQGWLGMQPAPLAARVENRERKTREEEKATKCLYFSFSSFFF